MSLENLNLTPPSPLNGEKPLPNSSPSPLNGERAGVRGENTANLPTLDTVITAVADFYRIPPDLACGARRDRKAAWPRHVAMTLSCEFSPHLPLRTIATAFRRTHSTVVYARRCVLTAQKNPTTRAHLTRLRKLIHIKLSS